jgi:hypothetical protein
VLSDVNTNRDGLTRELFRLTAVENRTSATQHRVLFFNHSWSYFRNGVFRARNCGAK